jgi:hypothetical protein
MTGRSQALAQIEKKWRHQRRRRGYGEESKREKGAG